MPAARVGRQTNAMNDTPKDPLQGIELPSSDELRGRQSVRATFRLTARAIEAISIVAVHLGIKQKSLFDHLIEDARTLELIAGEVEGDVFGKLDRVQKTYVLSRRTLSCLERTARSFDTPRDALVEYSIQRLLPVIAREREKHRRRKALLGEMRAFLNQGRRILEAAEGSLGADDPVFTKFELALQTHYNLQAEIEDFIQRGEIIEKF